MIQTIIQTLDSKDPKKWKIRSFKFNYPRDIWISKPASFRPDVDLNVWETFPLFNRLKRIPTRRWKWLETWKKIIRRLEIGIGEVRFEVGFSFRELIQSLNRRDLFHSTLWLSRLLLKWSFDRLQWDGYRGVDPRISRLYGRLLRQRFQNKLLLHSSFRHRSVCCC